ncbi:T9SS type A sorting domain-containing protein [Candidatus Desantisbacteria bacterium]|nr:T9SS type A sorting domain-containing protein [Candidatus Desantisbacteria bacterium]
MRDECGRTEICFLVLQRCNPFCLFLLFTLVDGKQVYGTATTQGFYYKPISPITEGKHRFEIQVADNSGNIAVRKNTFSIALPLGQITPAATTTTTNGTSSLTTPTVIIDKNSTSSWIIHGTATEAVIVELWGKQKLYNTTTPQDSGYFVFKTDPRRIPVDIATLYIVSVDNAGNRSSDQMLVSPSSIVSSAPANSIQTTTGIFIRSEDGGTITISGKLGQTTLKIPSDALVFDSFVAFVNISENTGKLAVANFSIGHEKNIIPVPDSYHCLSAYQTDGKPVSSTVQAMQLRIPYGDNDCDGIVDETTICVNTLRIFKLNEASNNWEMLTDSYPVTARCEVWANIYEFGIYAVMSCEPSYSLADVKVYPNPFYPDMDQECRFSSLSPGRLTIYIYNSAGEQVRILHRSNESIISWDGNNDSGEPVASGIYFYLIKGTKGKTTGKIGVIR